MQTNTFAENERISLELFASLPHEQIEAVMSQDDVDISPDFLGFVHIYKNLSDIIPTHFTVVDLGCAFNAQSFLFTNHKQYIAVDNFPGTIRFMSPNCVFYGMSISEFIERHIKGLYIDETFAICSYVPPWGADNLKLARDNFKNVFTFYPHGERQPQCQPS